MGHLRFVALRAGYEAGSLELPISAALIAAGLGHFSLWYCHGIFHLRNYPTYCLVKSIHVGLMLNGFISQV